MKPVIATNYAVSTAIKTGYNEIGEAISWKLVVMKIYLI